MEQTTPRLDLPLIQQGQAQKHVTHNEALAVLDALVQPVARDANRTAPPEDPREGDVHIIASGATDSWAGRDGELAVFFNGGWIFQTPKPGWSIQILSPSGRSIFDGATWISPADAPVSLLGINATADATNRLTVSADASLLTHDGADHRLVVNKADAGDTASLLFQSGFSGRAEMGTMGSDGFAVKVSSDGTTWHDAVTFDAATGAPAFPALPHFTATATGSWAEIAAEDTDLIFDQAPVDATGDFDMAAGAFTAPVAGTYVFVLNGVVAAETDARIALGVNGVTQTVHTQVLRGDVPLSFTLLQVLAAGDVVTVRTGADTALLRYHAAQTAFSGWKVA